ncbi:Arrestin domain-containing protein 3 [Liparis tanakae]|uniref:Arrestin domain-containing protein 3 n=1 Tax=Liparis tanakae TaxID=230148 RepID=A0A4Z2F3Z4_9TELE|nr:Arrestin domain-containing protein 3 [Liparis tanakae]
MMPSAVKSLKVTYKPVNEENTFTSGDRVSGEVSLELAKNCSINALWVKFKGKAEVLWTEDYGDHRATHHSKDKNMPSSFKGVAGEIVYLLEAKLSRSVRRPTKDSTEINFVSKETGTIDPELMKPQHKSKDKKLKVFNSGRVAMDVKLQRTVFFQGEGLQFRARIQNNSSRPIKLKYCFYRKHTFLAKRNQHVNTEDILKEVGEPIPPSAEEKFTRVVPIPSDVEPSIDNCSIIKVEYGLRVYLDVKYAFDPKIKFPIVILSARRVPAASGFNR